jgi:hypothetical protein
MKNFIVSVREVHIQPYFVEAEDEKDAIKKVEDGEGEIVDADFEYSHSLDSNTWTVEEDKQPANPPHSKVGPTGQCPICKHFGEDCTGR